MSDNLLAQLKKLKLESMGLPPVHLWNPEHIYDIDIRIDKDGHWFHEGDEIKRKQLVNLFASVLKKEDDEYFLITPVEKARIQVEDVPFIIVEMEINNSSIIFRTNLDELVELSKEHPITLDDNGVAEQALPYVEIRNGLRARLNRNVYYQAVELAEERDQKLFLQSEQGEFCIGEL